MSPNNERRKDARHETRFSLKLGPESLPAGQAFSTNGLNISRGGIYCQAPRFIPVLTKLRATLLLPFPSGREGGGPVERVLDTEMMVVWTDPEAEIPGCDSYRIGCSFLMLEEEKRDLLRSYLDSLGVERPS